jgi:hypothetical protein
MVEAAVKWAVGWLIDAILKVKASDTLKAELTDVGAKALDRVKQASLNAADATRKAS